jgi:hypothetical protein
MRRLGNPWAWLIVTAVVAACAVAGCGGSGDKSTTGAAGTGVQLHTLTAPNPPGSGNFHPGGGTTSRTETQPSAVRPGEASVRRALGPFWACLEAHGGQRAQFNPHAARPQSPPDPAQAQRNIQARIACIPELPPRLRQAAERLKRRYQQHQR